jgi:hypothetical protein
LLLLLLLCPAGLCWSGPGVLLAALPGCLALPRHLLLPAVLQQRNHLLLPLLMLLRMAVQWMVLLLLLLLLQRCL